MYRAAIFMNGMGNGLVLMVSLAESVAGDDV